MTMGPIIEFSIRRNARRRKTVGSCRVLNRDQRKGVGSISFSLGGIKGVARLVEES